MKPRRYQLAIVLLVLMAIAACNMGIGSADLFGSAADDEREGAQPLPTEPTDPSMALLRVGVPLISSVVLDALNATYQPAADDVGAQALLFATSVRFTLAYPPESGIVDNEWTVEIEPYYDPLDARLGGVVVSAHEITPGNNLTLTAEVFNSRVSDSTPVVAGTSEPFSVRPGDSELIRITASPPAAVVLDLWSGSHEASVLQTPFDALEEDWDVSLVVQGVGGEQWYRVKPAQTGDGLYALLHFDPVGSDAFAAAFRQDGKANGLYSLSWEFEWAVWDYAIGDQPTLPTSSRATMIVPLHDLPISNVPGAVLAEPGDDFYTGLLLKGLQDDTEASVSVSYQLRDYSHIPVVLELLDEGVLLPPTTVVEGVLRPVIEIDPEDGSLDFDAEQHHYVLDMDGLHAVGVNQLTFTVALDAVEDGHVMGWNFQLTARAWDGGDWPVNHYPEVQALRRTPGAERDTFELDYLVDIEAVMDELPDGATDLEFVFTVDSQTGGNGYSVSWANETPGGIIPRID